jgi:arsenite methyltransferase
LPHEWLNDTRLVGECLAGALYLEDFRRLLAAHGCQDVRFVSTSDFAIANEEIQQQVGNARFYSVTVRAFKVPLEDRCEDYGQLARYLGTIPGYPHAIMLDDHHLFVTDKPMLVCGNTADMICRSRYARHFNVTGDKSRHFGLFDCSSPRLGMVPGGSPLAPCC